MKYSAGEHRHMVIKKKSDGGMNMAKRVAVLLMALLILPAYAQMESGRAAVRAAAAVTGQDDGTVALYALPDENAEVLMEYYSGAPLEIIRRVGGAFYQVQVGNDEASLMGYMRAQDIAVDKEAARRVRPCFMKLEFNREAQVYAYCDESAQVIGTCELGKTYYAMSKNEEKWVQLFLPPQPHLREETDRLTCGFVHLETGMARGYWQELSRWETEPDAGELTREEAEALAIEYLAGGESADGTGAHDWELEQKLERFDGAEKAGVPDVYADRDELERMECRAYLCMIEGDEHPTAWFVYFWEQKGDDAVYAVLNVSNGELLGASHHYISTDSWNAYSVSPVL